MNIKGLYFENLKRKMGVIGQNINIGFNGKRQRSPAKNDQVVKPQEPTSLTPGCVVLSMLLLFCVVIVKTSSLSCLEGLLFCENTDRK